MNMFVSHQGSILIAYAVVLLSVMAFTLTRQQVIVIFVSLLVATPILLLPEFLRSCQYKTESFTGTTVPREPPKFDDLLQRVRTEKNTEQAAIEKEEEKEEVPGQDEGATPEEEKALHTGKDPYDFVDANPAYAEKDLLYYTKKGDLVDKQWTSFYTVLDTKHWKPYVAPPPVCLDREKPCPVCPQVTNYQGFMDLAELSR